MTDNLNSSEPHVLCLLPGLVPVDPTNNEFSWLSKKMTGHVLIVDWSKKSDKPEPLGRFGHTRLASQLPFPIKIVRNLYFYVSKGLALHRKTRFDAIVAYGPYTTATAGFLIRLFTGVPLIVDFPANPITPYMYSRETPTFEERLKLVASRIMSGFVARSANHVRLLFPSQLREVAKLPRERISAFPYFTASSRTPATKAPSERYALILGGPWYRKGADLAIQAFQLIKDEFPDLCLKIVGYCYEKEYFEELARVSDRIELSRPLPHAEALALVHGCAVFLCPSRAEGMPRVLIEAMAAKRPIVAAAVDGAPYYLEHGREALICRPDDSWDLAAKTRTVLNDPDGSAAMGLRAKEHAGRLLSEDCYVDYFRDMVDSTLGRIAPEQRSEFRIWHREELPSQSS